MIEESPIWVALKDSAVYHDLSSCHRWNPRHSDPERFDYFRTQEEAEETGRTLAHCCRSPEPSPMDELSDEEREAIEAQYAVGYYSGAEVLTTPEYEKAALQGNGKQRFDGKPLVLVVGRDKGGRRAVVRTAVSWSRVWSNYLKLLACIAPQDNPE